MTDRLARVDDGVHRAAPDLASIHVVATSIPQLNERASALVRSGSRASTARPGWSAAVRPGDIVVADYFADREELAHAASRGAGWLHILSTGIDGFDLARLSYPELTCSRGISGRPIAEFVLAAILGRAKRFPDLLTVGDTAGPLDELHDTTVALFGYGAIGRQVGVLASAFGMRVRALRGHREPGDEPSGVELVDDLLALVRDADHVVIVAPLTDRTRRAFGAGVLGAMRPTAHLVNVARGAIVDHDALLAALDQDRLAWATLDVTHPEPLPEGHRLLAHPRTTVTRHLAGRVAAAADRNWSAFVDNLDRRRAGHPLVGVIDRSRGY